MPISLIEIKIIAQSVKYYQWLKDHKKEVSMYEVGRRFEYAVMKKFRKHGFYCFRKFGSKGFEDCVAIRFGTVYFIQAKFSRYHDTKATQFDLEGLKKLAEQFGAIPTFAGVRSHKMYLMTWEKTEWKELIF